MIIASGPYISAHFRNTVKDNGWPVIDAGGAAEFGLATSPELSGPIGIERIAQAARGRILTSGEHALGWLTEHLGDSPAARASALFKDKAALEAFKKGKLQFLGQAGLAAGTKGIAGTPAFNDGVAIFTVTRFGLMGEFTVSGAKFSYRPMPGTEAIE